MGKLGRGRMALALVLFGLCCFVVGSPATAETAGGAAANAPGTGRLELTVLRDGVDVTSDYIAVATSMSGAMPVMLAPSQSGALAADLPAGQYMIVVMQPDAMKDPGAMAGQMGQMGQMPSGLPTIVSVAIVAGSTVNKIADVGGGGTFGDPDLFDDFDDFAGFEEPGNGTGDEGESAGPLDLDHIPTADELLELAWRYHDQFWELLSVEEQWMVERMTQRVWLREDLTPTREDVAEVTTAAAAIAAPGASREIPVVLAARAVIAMPESPLAVNNFGAMLRLIGKLRDSVTVLLAAKELDSKSPMILTNLANSLYELGDSYAAESLYNGVLAVAGDFGPALTGLGNIYVERKDYKRALEVMLRGAQAGYCGAVKNACSEAIAGEYGSPGSIPPLPPAWKGGIKTAPPAPGGGVGAQSTFTVPQIADWSSIATVAGYMSESGFRKVEAEIRRELSAATAQMQQLAAEIQSVSARRRSSGSALCTISFENQVFHLKLIEDHFKAIVHRSATRAHEEMRWDEAQSDWKEIGERYLHRLEAAKTDAEAEAAHAAFCKEASAFARAQFTKNKGIWTQFYSEAASAAEDYWAFSRDVLDSIYDPLVYKREEITRRMIVYGMLAEIAGTGGLLAELPVIHSGCSRCGGTGRATSDGGSPNAPQSSDKCPFKGGRRFALSLGPVEYKVDCSTVEIGFALIAAGSLKWDFKEKRVTSVFVGVGGQMGVGPASLGTKWGTQLTFDTDGSVSDITADWSSSMGVGPVSGELSTDSGLVVGVPGLEATVAR
jgi:tetratricopeptide (TPR) repeat protein